jgi:hypothetical protein
MDYNELKWHEAVMLFKDYRPAGLVAHTEDKGWFYLMRQHFTNEVPAGASFSTLDEAVESAHSMETVHRVKGMILGDPVRKVGLAFAQKKRNAWRALVYDQSDLNQLPGEYDSLASIVRQMKKAETAATAAAE